MAKFDAHVHANVDDETFLAAARRDGFELLPRAVIDRLQYADARRVFHRG